MSMRQLKISKSITSRDSHSVYLYLREINKLQVITSEEEITLFPLIRNGDQAALNKIVSANLRFVITVAKQYQNQGHSLADLINEGNIGLITAARKFDETKGFRFISYAVWWIRQQILTSLGNDTRMVRIPLHKRNLEASIRKANAVLEQTLERNATPQELADFLLIDQQEIEMQMTVHNKHLSLDTPLAGEEENTLLEVLPDPDAVNHYEKEMFNGSLKTEISRVLMRLSERQRETLCAFFGIGRDGNMSLEEIAKKMDLTTERVRQIKDKALMTLRTNCNPDLLRGFLGA